MSKLLWLICCGAALVHAADDPWEKVKKISSGADLRVFKKGSVQPLLVKMGEATDERLVIIDKNRQTSIAREDIDRIDARPSNKRSVTRESKTTTTDNATDPRNAAGPGQTGQTTSTNTGLSIGGKPDFETVYRRPPPAPKPEPRP